LWWEQTFRIAGDLPVWVSAPCITWQYAGITMKAAGLETVELKEARNTWFEILAHSLSAMGCPGALSAGFDWLGSEVRGE